MKISCKNLVIWSREIDINRTCDCSDPIGSVLSFINAQHSNGERVGKRMNDPRQNKSSWNNGSISHATTTTHPCLCFTFLWWELSPPHSIEKKTHAPNGREGRCKWNVRRPMVHWRVRRQVAKRSYRSCTDFLLGNNHFWGSQGNTYHLCLAL
jgi:hypothetical protein